MATRTHTLRTIAVALIVVALGACSSTGTAPSAAGTVAPGGATGVCADAAAVETALTELKDLDLATVGKAGLTSAIENVGSSITTLASSAKDAAGPEVEALTAAIATLRTAVEDLTSDANVAEKAADIRAAVTGVETAAKALKAALTQCS